MCVPLLAGVLNNLDTVLMQKMESNLVNFQPREELRATNMPLKLIG